jgi:glyoxylase-like metal-dependent hydrolase (beta-lactamase superfamily II)
MSKKDKYSVKVLLNSHINFPVPACCMYFQEKLDKTLDNLCGYVWLVEGNGKIVVVDTGLGFSPGGPSECGPQIIRNFTVEPGHDTASLLLQEGITPPAVDYLILTHLHDDHCSNVRLFTGAKILISQRGWHSVMAPEHPGLVPEPLFPRSVYSHLVNEAWDRVELLPDEVEILPGLEVFWVGGHTPCSQAVKIDTPRGRVILAGDTLFLFGNLEENIPVAYCTNLAECYHAMDRYREEGDLILPNHDPLLMERYPDGVIA